MAQKQCADVPTAGSSYKTICAFVTSPSNCGNTPQS